MNTIELKNVAEKYRIKFVKDGRVVWSEIWALEGLNLSVAKGTVLGVIGANGSGKTTLLKLIAGMLVPDKGEVSVKGKISALMELGAGFDPEFTGRENVVLNAKMYGIEKEALDEKMGEILAFAGLGDFIDAPVKYYSQGMYMRLAFALGVFVGPDVFLIDDILSVGDEEAQRKCLEKIYELKQNGKTMVIVSHDMHMIRQLCDRVIFLEKGLVAREGSPDEVVSYYLEGVGSRAGFAALEEGDVRLAFNNGSVTVRYKGASLMVPPGGYVSFFVPALNRWCPSQVFSWRIKESSSSHIVAVGTYGPGEGSLVQEWSLSLKNGRLSWQVRAKGDFFKEPHIDMILSANYDRWVTSQAERPFPPFAHRHDWHNVAVLDRMKGIVGILSKEGLPCVVFMQETLGPAPSFFNTGSEQAGRVLQVFFDKDLCVSFSLDFFDDEVSCRAAMDDQAPACQARLEAQRKKRFASHAITHGDLCLLVDEEDKRLRLYHKDDEMTGPGGISGFFEVKGKGIYFKDALWGVKKINETQLQITLESRESDLVQIWHCSFPLENVLRIKAELEIKEPLSVTRQDFSFELKDVYRMWLTAQEEGLLKTGQEFSSIYPIRWKNNKARQVIFCGADKAKYPDLSFSVFSRDGARILNIHKRKGSGEECLAVLSALIVPPFDSILSAGRHLLFDGEFSFANEREHLKDEGSQGGCLAEIKKDGLRFVFDGGRGRIFAADRELTKDLSIYTSVRSSNFWVDSSQAYWQIKEKDDSRIVAVGYWPFLSLSQTWRMEMKAKGLISWEVEAQFHAETDIEVEQANIMLSPLYTKWKAADAFQGVFPEDYAQDQDILPFIRCWYGRADAVAAAGDGLPQIVLRRDAHHNFLNAIIENTDNLYQARLLQYQKANKRKLSPGSYSFFGGTIEIGI